MNIRMIVFASLLLNMPFSALAEVNPQKADNNLVAELALEAVVKSTHPDLAKLDLCFTAQNYLIAVANSTDNSIIKTKEAVEAFIKSVIKDSTQFDEALEYLMASLKMESTSSKIKSTQEKLIELTPASVKKRKKKIGYALIQNSIVSSRNGIYITKLLDAVIFSLIAGGALNEKDAPSRDKIINILKLAPLKGLLAAIISNQEKYAVRLKEKRKNSKVLKALDQEIKENCYSCKPFNKLIELPLSESEEYLCEKVKCITNNPLENLRTKGVIALSIDDSATLFSSLRAIAYETNAVPLIHITKHSILSSDKPANKLIKFVNAAKSEAMKHTHKTAVLYFDGLRIDETPGIHAYLTSLLKGYLTENPFVRLICVFNTGENNSGFLFDPLK